MIPRAEFLNRRDNFCKKCVSWDGVCLLGHNLGSPQGCPQMHFAPIQGAQYAEVVQKPESVKKPCNCGSKSPVDPITWVQVVTQFGKAMLDWLKEGLPLVDAATHQSRNDTCKSNECGQYRYYQCMDCKCITYLKTKLATEECPRQLWLKVKSSKSD